MNATCYKCGNPAIRYACNRKSGVLCTKCRSEYASTRYSRQKEKIIERADRWNRVNAKRRNEGERARYARDKAASISAYGGKCKLCGESHQIFLVIDHVDDNGAADRLIWKNKVADIHKWLKLNDYPQSYQLLCGSCNLKKERLRRRALSSSNQRTEAKRLLVIAAYGGVCRCCGENDVDKLVIDHINGGGSKEKKGYPSRNIYLFLAGRPVNNDKFRVLCQSCNQAIASCGSCPHTSIRALAWSAP